MRGEWQNECSSHDWVVPAPGVELYSCRMIIFRARVSTEYSNYRDELTLPLFFAKKWVEEKNNMDRQQTRRGRVYGVEISSVSQLANVGLQPTRWLPTRMALRMGDANASIESNINAPPDLPRGNPFPAARLSSLVFPHFPLSLFLFAFSQPAFPCLSLPLHRPKRAHRAGPLRFLAQTSKASPPPRPPRVDAATHPPGLFGGQHRKQSARHALRPPYRVLSQASYAVPCYVDIVMVLQRTSIPVR